MCIGSEVIIPARFQLAQGTRHAFLVMSPELRLVLYAVSLISVIFVAATSLVPLLPSSTHLVASAPPPSRTLLVPRYDISTPAERSVQRAFQRAANYSELQPRRRGRHKGANGRGGRRRGRGRARGGARIRSERQRPVWSAPDETRPATSHGDSACAQQDEALLHGSTCSPSSPVSCPLRYVLLRVKGNDKFLAPREQGIVYAAVRSRFKDEGIVPLQRIAWKLVPVGRGWVQLQHVLTGKYLRILPPPHPDAWVFVVVADAQSFGKETWFQLQAPDGKPVDHTASLETVHLRAHSTGAFLNYRLQDFVRGHGNTMRGGRWPPADRLPSTRLGLTSLGLPELQADIARWAERKRACLAPCKNASAAAAEAAAGVSGWREFCWKHYAEPLCNAMARTHHVLPGISWGSLPVLAQLRWARMDCHKYVAAADVQRAVSPELPLPRRLPLAVVDDIPSLREGGVHCAPAVEGVLLIAVADRPNQFLCHYFTSALRHGLKPVILGWNPASWNDVNSKPWTYHLGAKLLLPLHYLQHCRYPDDTLVVFTDQDVVFQGGYKDLKQAYSRASASAGNAPLLFSTEKESYPLELQGLYPRSPAGSVFDFLNSGMWAGPVSASRELLQVMTGVDRAGKLALGKLMRHYVNWGALDTHAEPIPPAFLENDQTKYAGLYVAQAFADACTPARARSVQLRGHGCFRFLHDGRQRCSHGRAVCNNQAGAHSLSARIALDHRLSLFENMYHAGHHRVDQGHIVNARSGLKPMVVHFNGPAKVIFERDWGLPWDATSGRTPVSSLLMTQRAAFTKAAREAAINNFQTDVTFIDPMFRKVTESVPFRFQCEE